MGTTEVFCMGFIAGITAFICIIGIIVRVDEYRADKAAKCKREAREEKNEGTD